MVKAIYNNANSHYVNFMILRRLRNILMNIVVVDMAWLYSLTLAPKRLLISNFQIFVLNCLLLWQQISEKTFNNNNLTKEVFLLIYFGKFV